MSAAGNHQDDFARKIVTSLDIMVIEGYWSASGLK